MNCEDMMKIPALQKVLNLKAGEKGLSHSVRWIYFADCLQCVQSEYNMENYIHGGEFVILTNRSVTEDHEKLMKLISQMWEYGISALGINEGQIPDELVAYCEDNRLPLFELPEKFPLIDLSQILCQELVREEGARNSKEQLFSSLLNSEHLSRETILSQARALQVDLTGSLAVIEFHFQKETKEAWQKDAAVLSKKMISMIHRELSCLENMLILPQMESVLLLAPVERIGIEPLKDLLSQICDKVESSCRVAVEVGVGSSSEYLEDIKKSRKEAETAIRIARLTKSRTRVSFYSDQGVYALISQIPNGKMLDTFVDNHIGKLMSADALQEGNLCETLENYLAHNCNAKEAAEAMYIHRNTFNYRMRKIQEILGKDFNDLNDCLMVKLAFMIRDYRNWQRHG